MDDFITGGDSLPAFKFNEVGDTVSGILRNITPLEDRAPDGTPKTWSNGDPMQVFVFDLDTNNTGSADVAVWARGNLVKVLREAFKTAGLKPSENPKVTIKFAELGEAKNKGYHPPKLFKAKVEPAPQPAAAMDDF
ncbi:MAG: hypothetical protein ACO3VQ_11560 [Ilumatobacteraceae bacterium]